MNISHLKIIFIFYCLFSISSTDARILDEKYVAGQILLTVPDSYVEFPLEIYGAYISFGKSDSIIQIERILFLALKPGSRRIEKERILDYDSLLSINPSIQEKVQLNFSNNILRLFKKYRVTVVKRISKVFSPLDTIPHIIYRQGSNALATSPNYNKYLIIEFSKDFDAKVVAEDFIKLKDISEALPNYYLTPH